MISNNVKKFKKHELIAMVQEICAISIINNQQRIKTNG